MSPSPQSNPSATSPSGPNVTANPIAAAQGPMAPLSPAEEAKRILRSVRYKLKPPSKLRKEAGKVLLSELAEALEQADFQVHTDLLADGRTEVLRVGLDSAELYIVSFGDRIQISPTLANPLDMNGDVPPPEWSIVNVDYDPETERLVGSRKLVLRPGVANLREDAVSIVARTVARAFADLLGENQLIE